ncbi:MAG: hypothetical protein U0636_00890 [Phycisphaerales bacterium]
MRLNPWLVTAFAAVVVLATATVTHASPQVRYVHPDGDDSLNNGTSWSQPWKTLNHALDELGGQSPGFNQIWLAMGATGFAYTPDIYDEEASFVVTKSVAIYGGFVGTETSIAARAAGARTVLSGDLGKYGRSYHIVTIPNGITNGTIRFDGIRFEHSGHAGLDGFGDPLPEGPGGGAISACSTLITNWGTLVLRNCDFFDNVGWLDGGAVRCKQWSMDAKGCSFTYCKVMAADGSQFNPTTNNDYPCHGGAIKHEGAPLALSRCTFSDNLCDNYLAGSAYELGGAVYASLEGGSSSNGYIVNCEFRGNLAAGGPDGRGRAGALWLSRPQSSAVPAGVINCVFADNRAGDWGGAMYTEGGCVVNGCTLCGNICDGVGGGIAVDAGACSLQNSIVWNNEAAAGSLYDQQVHLIGAASSLSQVSSCVSGGPTTAGNINADPAFEDEGATPRNLRLTRASPSVRAADSNLRTADFTDVDDQNGSTELHPWDLDKTARLKNCALDMGAYELEDTCPADSDFSGVVDGTDLGLLLGAWGGCPGCQADLDCSGTVDGTDLGLLLGSWGACSGGSMMMVSMEGGASSGMEQLLDYLGASSVAEASSMLSAMEFEQMRSILETFIGS